MSFDFDKVQTQILSMIEKAEKASDGGEALKWSQAACNAANAVSCFVIGRANAEERARESEEPQPMADSVTTTVIKRRDGKVAERNVTVGPLTDR